MGNIIPSPMKAYKGECVQAAKVRLDIPSNWKVYNPVKLARRVNW